MADEERAELEKLTERFLAEVQANPSPTREQWRALVDKWQRRVNVEVLLTYGSWQGWLS